MATNEAVRTPAVEDYTKAIFSLESRRGEPVSTKTLAERLGITPGSVSAMLKRLDELGLITHVPYRGVRLTPAGRRIALEVIRHHRLLESYLAEVLGMPWDRVHAEAEVLEHVLSDDLEELIAAKLGHPTVDPHGDPIPSVEFDLEERETVGPRRAADRRRRTLRARLGLRPRDAPLPGRAGRSRSARRSRSSSASRSAGRCSCASAAGGTPTGARSRSATR